MISAEYYDRLNVATAYFPSQNNGQPLMQEGGPEGAGMQQIEGMQGIEEEEMEEHQMEGAPDQIQEDIDEEDEMDGEDEDEVG